MKNSKTIIKGDQKIKCISAASIVAKVYRDLYMIKLGNKFPNYNWHKNFGYGTSQHLNALKKFGVTSFFIEKAINQYTTSCLNKKSLTHNRL